MSNLDPELIYKTAHLARLTLTPKQQQQMSKDLGNIFELFGAINQPEINQLDPLGHPLEQRQRLREDIAHTQDLSASIAQNAPHAENGFITVPKVIE